MAKQVERYRPTFNDLSVPRYTPFFKPVPIPVYDKDTDVICVPISRHWLMHILNCMMTLNFPDKWLGDAEQQLWALTQWSNIIVDLMQEERCTLDFRNKPTDPCVIQYSNDGGQLWLDGWNMSACVVPSVTRIFRYNSTNNYHYEYSTDGGENWNDASTDDIRLTSPQPEFPDVANPACVAAMNFIDNMKLWVQTIVDVLTAGGGIFAIAVALVAAAALFITFPPAAVFIAPLAALLIQYGLEAIEDAFTEEFWEWLLCAVYVEFTLIDFENTPYITGLAMDNILNRLLVHGGLASEIVRSILVLTGAAGVASASVMGNNVGDACFECLNWVHEFLSGFGSIPLDTVALGSYNLTDDRYDDVKEPAQTRMSVQVNVDFGEEITITRIVAKIVSLINNPFTARNNKIYWKEAGGTLHEILNQPITNSGTYVLDTGQIEQACHGLVFEFFGRHTGNASDFHRFTECVIYGTGEDPFA